MDFRLGIFSIGYIYIYCLGGGRSKRVPTRNLSLGMWKLRALEYHEQWTETFCLGHRFISGGYTGYTTVPLVVLKCHSLLWESLPTCIIKYSPGKLKTNECHVPWKSMVQIQMYFLLIVLEGCRIRFLMDPWGPCSWGRMMGWAMHCQLLVSSYECKLCVKTCTCRFKKMLWWILPKLNSICAKTWLIS